MTKSSEATRTSSTILRTSGNAVRFVSTNVSLVVQVLAAHPVLHLTLVGLLMLGLLSLVVMSLGRFQVWIISAGFFLVAMGIVSAVQEIRLSKTASFLDEEMDRCSVDMVTLPHLAPLASSASTSKQQEKGTNDDGSSMTVNIVPPSIVNMTTQTTLPIPSSLQEKSSRRESEKSIVALESASNTAAVEVSFASSNSSRNKLDVLHCGTVIDIQGTQGFIIPHDLCVDATTASTTICSDAATQSQSKSPCKMPLVIPFDLNEEETAVRREIAVGKTVEFAYAAISKSASTLRALHVTLVPTNDGIVKSRSALQSCKQARKVLFARAMEELTIISPRNVPVKHHVDLIKYAEKLDDHDASFDKYF